MANKDTMDILLGINEEASLAVMKASMERINETLSDIANKNVDSLLKDLPRIQSKISADRQMEDPSTMFANINKEILEIQKNFNAVSTKPTLKQLYLLQKEMEKINGSTEFKVVSGTADLSGQVKDVVLEFKNLEGVVQRVKGSFGEEGLVLQDSTAFKDTLLQDLKEIEKEYKDTRKRIADLEKMEVSGKATDSDLVELEQKRKILLNEQSKIVERIAKSEEMGMLGKEESLRLLTEQEERLDKINQASLSKVKTEEQKNNLKEVNQAAAEYKKLLKEQYDLEKKIEQQKATEGDLERFNILKQEISASRELASTTLSGQQKIISAEKELEKVRAQAASVESVKTREEIEKRLLKLSEDLYKENVKRFKAIKKGDQETGAASRARMGQIYQEFLLTKKGAEEKINSAVQYEILLKNVAQAERDAADLNRDRDASALRAQEKYQQSLDKTYGAVIELGQAQEFQGQNLEEAQKAGSELNKKILSELGLQNGAIVKSKTVVDDYGNTFQQLTIQQDKSARKIEEYTYTLDKQNGVWRKGNFQMKNNTTFLQKYTEQLKTAAQKLTAYLSVGSVIYKAFNSMQEGVNFTKELDKELTQVAIVLGSTRDQVQYLRQEYAAWGEELGKTVEEISAVNTELIRQGISLKESEARLRTIMQLSSVGAISAQESLKIITASVNAMHIGHERAADIIVKSSQISASSVEEIGEAFTKTASSAYAAGVEMEQVGAILSTLLETTQEGPRELGTSVKTILARFNRVNEETGELNEELNDVQSAIESIGVAFTDADGQIRNAYDILEDTADVWKTLTKNQQAYVATQSAGVRQQNRFFALMNNFNRTQLIHNQLLESAGTLYKGYETYLDSTEAKLNKNKVALEKVWMQLFDGNTISMIYELGTGVLKLVDGIGALTVVGGAAGAMLSKLAVSHGLERIAIDLWNSAIIETKLSLSILTSQVGVANVASKLWTLTTMKLSAALTAAKTTLVNLTSTPLFWFAAVGAAIGLVVKGIREYNEGQEQMRANLIKTLDTFVKTKQEFLNNSLELAEGIERLNELNDKIKTGGGSAQAALTKDELSEFYEIQQKIGELAPDLIESQDAFGRVLIKQGVSAEQAAKALENGLEKQRQAILDNKYALKLALEEENKEIVENALETEKEIARIEKTLSQEGIGPSQTENLTIAKAGLKDQYALLVSEQQKYNTQLKDIGRKYLPLIDAELNGLKDYQVDLISDEDLAALAKTPEYIEDLIGKLKGAEGFAEQGIVKEVMEAFDELNDSYRDGEVEISSYNVKVSELRAKLTDLKNDNDSLTSSAEKYGLTTEGLTQLIENLMGTLAKKEPLDKYNIALQNMERHYNDAISTTKEYAEEIDDLNELYRAAEEGQSVSLDTMLDTLETMPELANAFRVENGLIKINKEAVEDLAKAKAIALKEDLIQKKKEYEANSLIAGSLKTVTDLERLRLRMKGNYEELGINETELDNVIKDLRDMDYELRAFDNLINSISTVKPFESIIDSADVVSERFQLEINTLQKLENEYSIASEKVKELQEQYDRLEEGSQERKEIGTQLIEALQEEISAQKNLLIAKQEQLEIEKDILENAGLLNNGRLVDNFAQVMAEINADSSKSSEELEKIQNALENVQRLEFSEISSLESSIRNSTYALKDLLDAQNALKYSLEEIKELEQESIDAKQEMIDLYVEMKQDYYKEQIEALEEELDKYEKIVDARKEALKIARETARYDSDRAEKEQSIGDLQSEIAELSLDTGRGSVAKRRELEEQLAKEQKDLAEFQADHAYDVQEKALDDELAKYKDVQQKEIDAFENKINDVITLQQEATTILQKDLEEGTNKLYTQLMAWNEKYRWGVQNDITSAWETATLAVNKYKNALGDIGVELSSIEKDLDAAVSKANDMKIISDMKTNSTLWHSASDKEKEDLHAKNVQLAKELENAIYDPNGYWKWKDTGTRIYGNGGFVDSPELAVVGDQPEFIVPQKDIMDFVGEVNKVAGIPQVSSGSGGISIVNEINVEGNLDKEAIPKLEEILKKSANYTIEKINSDMKNKGFKTPIALKTF